MLCMPGHVLCYNIMYLLCFWVTIITQYHNVVEKNVPLGIKCTPSSS